MLPISSNFHFFLNDFASITTDQKSEKLNEIIKNIGDSQIDLTVIMEQFENVWVEISDNERSQLSQSKQFDELVKGVILIYSKASECDVWLDRFITFTEKLDLYDPLWIKSFRNLFIKWAEDVTISNETVVDLAGKISNILSLNSMKPDLEFVKSGDYVFFEKEFFLANLLDLSNLINDTDRLHQIVLCTFKTIMPIPFNQDHIKGVFKLLRKEGAQGKIGDFVLNLAQYFDSDTLVLEQMLKILISKHKSSLNKGVIEESYQGLCRISKLIKILRADSVLRLLFLKSEVKDAIVGLLLFSLYQLKFSSELHLNYNQTCKDIVVDAGVDKSWKPSILQHTITVLNFQHGPFLDPLSFVDAFSDLIELIDSNLDAVEKIITKIFMGQMMINSQKSYKIFENTVSQLPQIIEIKNQEPLKAAIDQFLRFAAYPISWLINDVNMFAQAQKNIFLDPKISTNLLNRVTTIKNISYCQFLKLSTYFLMFSHENSKNSDLRNCLINFLKHPMQLSTLPTFFTLAEVKNFNQADILKKYKGEFDLYKDKLLNMYQITGEQLQEIDDASNFNWIVAIVDQIYQGCVNKLWRKGFSFSERVQSKKKTKPLHKKFLQAGLKFAPLKEELLICLFPIYARIKSEKLKQDAFTQMAKIENLKVNAKDEKELICIKVKNELIVGKLEGERQTHYAKILG